MGDSRDDEEKSFQSKKPVELQKSTSIQSRIASHRLKVNTKRHLLKDPTPTKFLDANMDPFDGFCDMRSNGDETPATSKPRLLISPTLHTPVANLNSPVFPTPLLTTSSTSLLTPVSGGIDSPIFPVPKLSPVPGVVTLPRNSNIHQDPRVDLKTILGGNLLSQAQVKVEPGSPKESRKQQIADRIRRRVDIPTGQENHCNETSSPPSSMSPPQDEKSGINSGTNNPRKRYPSEMNGQIDEKRRKFLERNRAAAQRCREKRKQWINNLQAEKFNVQEENNKLHIENHKLRQEVARLKCLILEHKDCLALKPDKDTKLSDSLLHPVTSLYAGVTENSDIKKPSPTKPQPSQPIRIQPPRSENNGDLNGHQSELMKAITPNSTINSDPLGPLLEGLMNKEGYGRNKFSPLFGPISSFQRSPIVGLSPLAIGPNLGLITSFDQPYTITSLDSRLEKSRGLMKDKDISPDRRQENPCPEVANGLAMLQEALSKT